MPLMSNLGEKLITMSPAVWLTYVIECIGSVAKLNTKPQRNSSFHIFENEFMVDWNGLEASLGKNIVLKKIYPLTIWI